MSAGQTLQGENEAKYHSFHLEAWHAVRWKKKKKKLIHPKKDNKQYQVANEMKRLNPQFPPSLKFLQVFQLFLHYLLLHFLLCQVSHSKLPCGEEMLLSLTSLCSITPSHTPAHNLTSLTPLSSPT